MTSTNLNKADALVDIRDKATGTRAKYLLARGYLQTPSQTSSSVIIHVKSCFTMASRQHQNLIQMRSEQPLSNDAHVRVFDVNPMPH